MSIIDRLFKKKGLAVDSNTGEVTGEIPVAVNGKRFGMGIKTSVERIVEAGRLSADPDSCEREPNADEVKLPVDFDICIVACDETGTMIMLQNKAALDGYNHYVVSKEILVRNLCTPTTDSVSYTAA